MLSHFKFDVSYNFKKAGAKHAENTWLNTSSLLIMKMESIHEHAIANLKLQIKKISFNILHQSVE